MYESNKPCNQYGMSLTSDVLTSCNNDAGDKRRASEKADK